MVYVLIVIGAAATLFSGTAQFVLSHVRYNMTLEPREQAFQAAESGVYFYRWYLAHNLEGLTSSQISHFWHNDPIGVDDNGDGDCDDPDTADGDGDGTEAFVADFGDHGKYKICIIAPESYSTVVLIESEGIVEKNGKTYTRKVRARQRKPSWSEFALVANAFTRLSSGTEVFGPIHVNGGFHFDGTAHNIVSSAVSSYYDSDFDVQDTRPGVWAAANPESGGYKYIDTSDHEHFLAGKRYPVPIQDFNSLTSNFGEMRTASIAHGTYYNEVADGGVGYYVVFGAPHPSKVSIYEVEDADAGYMPQLRVECEIHYYPWGGAYQTCHTKDPQVIDLPEDGVMYFEDNVWVEGHIPSSYALTLAAHSPDSAKPRIFLGTDDIEYEDYDSGCILALAAEGNIEFIRDSDGDLSASSGSDAETLNIDAILLSQYGRVGRYHWPYDYKDTITLYGAIATNTRMGFGYTDGTGFQNRNINFDGSLLYNPPPFFPTEGSYEIDMWEEIDS